MRREIVNIHEIIGDTMRIYCKNKDCGLSISGVCRSNELRLERDLDNENCNVLVCMSHEWGKPPTIYEPLEPKRG